MKIGILGVGHLAGFLVQGAQAAGHEFVLSPRNPAKAAALAARYGCVVVGSNQAVLGACQHVLVCLPAKQGLEILRGLTFAEGQVVCSAMAGVSLADLAAAVAPAQALVCMMPGYANAYAAGPSLLYPPHPDWAKFLSACGPVHEMPDARSFETAAVFGAMSGASVAFIQHLAQWFQAEGLDAQIARRLVAETLRGNAEVYLQSPEPAKDICKGVATPGGITEQLLSDLHRDGALESWHCGMTRILQRMAPKRG